MAELLQFPAAGIDLTGPAPDSARPTPSSLPPDHEARRRALDIHRSSIVEAPAGSGKTGLLLQRFLKLLSEGGVAQPEEVLAITFTRKATAELRERVLEQLHAASTRSPLSPSASTFDYETRALAEAVLAIDARLHWNLLEQPHRLRIRTIDAVCGEIARTLPLLSGSGASHPVEDAEPLYREAARRTLLQLGCTDASLNDALRTVLLHRDGSISDCERLLARMLAQREQWGELVPLEAATLTDEHLDTQIRPRLERSLEAIICSGLNRALEALPAGLLDELTRIAARLGLEPAYKPDEASPISLCANRHLPPAARVEDLEHWVALIHLVLKPSDHDWRGRFTSRDLSFTISKPDAEHLKALVDSVQTDTLRDILRSVRNLPPARYPDEQWNVAKALFRLLRHALAQLRVLFAETGQCDFAELSLAARDALSADDGRLDLASTPGARLTHLLVDEMQDTSSAQYSLLELLTRSWDGRSQTLFLVGDPKQSIYLFRQARVERFLRTVRDRRLGDIPLDTLRLTANFRSQGALVEAFNDTFAQLFPAVPRTDILEVPFARAEPTHEPRTAPDKAIHWHRTILGDNLPPGIPKPTTADLHAAHARREARQIRRIIEAWQSRPLPPNRRKLANGQPEPWRIAVLTRARSHLAPIVAEFSRDDRPSGGRAPIPFRAIQIDSLAERSEVLDIFALTRALLHLADRIAWLAVLRAPWCGLSLADLLALTGEGPRSSSEATVLELAATRRHHLSPEGQQLLDRVWPTLTTAVETLGRTSLAVHVERTWLSLGGDAPLTPDRQANVRRFLALLHELSLDGGRIDLSVLIARLADLYAEPAPNDHAVDLLTIHKAKGLEFDLVLVPSLERRANRSSSALLNWLELDSPGEDAAEILLAPIWSRGEDSDKLNKWLGRARYARELAETKRLLYVASTRAREELHLFAAAERTTKRNLRPPMSGTLLHAAWPAAKESFLALDALGTTPRAASQPQAAQPPRRAAAATETQPSSLAAALRESLQQDSADDSQLEFAGFTESLALAASADSNSDDAEPSLAFPPVIHRPPRGFDPLARFANPARLPYAPASTLAHEALFDRPEGSFAVRAFGNVVHRFLELLSTRLESVNDPAALLAELPSWQPRLLASLRSEGLAPAHAEREAPRALLALQNTLTDPIGRWILTPHPGAANERSLTTASATLRADRTFLAGPTPLTGGPDANTAIWIIDFKTTEQGSRSPELFEREELLKYRAQLERYAATRRSLSNTASPIHLGLFYPLIPRLIHWPADDPSQP
jgi:ATP-dependent helicase/nuclease subunit A